MCCRYNLLAKRVAVMNEQSSVTDVKHLREKHFF